MSLSGVPLQGTAKQAQGESIQPLEPLRDDCLIDVTGRRTSSGLVQERLLERVE